MRRLLLAAACLFTACESPIPGNVIEGDGVTSAWSRGLTGFTQVRNHTGLRLEVRESTDYTVATILDSNLQALLFTELQGDVLDLAFTEQHGVAPSPFSLVVVTLPDFRGASVMGPGPLRIDGVTGAKDLTLATSSSGAITFSGTAHSLAIDVSGAGNVTASGNVQLLNATTRAEGSIDALRLTASSAILFTNAAGSVTALNDGGPLSATVLGKGNIDWWGTASSVRLDDHGLGSIHAHGDLP